MENWKTVEGYEGIYEVSDQGNIRSLTRTIDDGRKIKGRVLRQTKNSKSGYMYVGLHKNGTRKLASVHRLVAKAFVENPKNKETVNHLNEVKTDNRACNLEWLTIAENVNYGTHTLRATLNKPDMSGIRHFNYGKFGAESHTHKGRVIGVSVKDPSIVVEFDTAATAKRALNLRHGGLSDAINGKTKSCGGYYWRRVDE